MRKDERALRWIVRELHATGVPFWISGGYAARVYGSARALADIDIMTRNAALPVIAARNPRQVRFGPKRYFGKHWRLELLTLRYGGQEIDIGGADDAYIRNARTRAWVLLASDFSKATIRTISRMRLPIIPKEELIAYKRVLGRNVDSADIGAICRRTV